MQNIQDNIYAQCVNRVLDYVYLHIDDELSLKSLAGIAGFSDFHFHRIFKSIVGETLNQFVWRVRVERGAAMMRANPDIKVSDVAFACGFTSLAGYSRAFKTRFGLAPTQWDRHTRLQGEQPTSDVRLPNYQITELLNDQQQFNVNLRQMQKQRVAYIRVYDSYQTDNRIEVAYHQLIEWYLRQGGQLDDTTLYGMSMDDRDITPEALCRFDWCMSIPDNWQADTEISIRDIPACFLAAVTIDGGDLQLEDKVWQYLWRCWLPHSQYQPMDLPAMEIYHRLPHKVANTAQGTLWDELYLDCAIPITRFSIFST